MSIVTCGNCGRSWDEDADPAPSALCHWCHGRGCSTAEILNCGHAPTSARDANGETMCYDCAASKLKADALMNNHLVAYVSSDGHKVTTWDGQTLGTVIQATGGFRRTHYVSRLWDGRLWWGTGPSESGTYVSLRPYKNQ